MPRYFIQLSFDGTRYHGWQVQKNAHSVQAELNHALATVFRQETETLGCGRTDTGVHATEFFAQADLDNEIPLPRDLNNVLYRLNSILPPDISVKNIFAVDEGFNARFDAVTRSYQYLIHHSKNPFLVNRSFYRKAKPDIMKMNEACTLLLGTHDFSCFSKSRTQVKTNTCRIEKAEWSYKKLLLPLADKKLLVFEIKADRFLRNMVRAIVGTMLELGDGELSLQDFKKIIESKNRSLAGFSVPACGLYLTEIKYTL